MTRPPVLAVKPLGFPWETADPFLFCATVEENIAYAQEDASREDVEAAARQAQAHEFIAALPDGYDTRVGERGLTLSDEAMLSATSGELEPIVTGLIYCAAITTFQYVYALRRAREWTAALAGWCEAQPQLVPFAGSCLVFRAELMQLGGAWAEAIRDADG